jgi:hypothetical protein
MKACSSNWKENSARNDNIYVITCKDFQWYVGLDRVRVWLIYYNNYYWVTRLADFCPLDIFFKFLSGPNVLPTFSRKLFFLFFQKTQFIGNYPWISYGRRIQNESKILWEFFLLQMLEKYIFKNIYFHSEEGGNLIP